MSIPDRQDRLNISNWQACLATLEEELPADDFSTFILPLQADQEVDGICLLAPNNYIMEHVREHHYERMLELLAEHGVGRVDLRIGSNGDSHGRQAEPKSEPSSTFAVKEGFFPPMGLSEAFTFDTFVKGGANELAYAAAVQVSEDVGSSSCNPLILYGGVGLGKTHLMHAIGHAIAQNRPDLKVQYMYSQKFTEDMVKAIQQNTMLEFTQYYRSVNVLLMDDIQFLAKGPKTQEEFFHVFNWLHEAGGQIVLTSDCHPKEMEGLEKRLESRFVWGMTAPVEPPDLETRVAILMKKAELDHVDLSDEVAFFIAKRIKSNVRELEGALRRVTANATMTGQPITTEQVQSSLKDLFAIQDRQIGIENIQKTVAEYYNVSIRDLLSKRRTRSIARPRQVAMSLARELTNRSLPEIGDAFGGRDHTTVLHACQKVEELRESDRQLREDYNNLQRLLTV